MRTLAIGSLVVAAACYRGGEPVPVTANQPVAQCSNDDDLRRPVLDNGMSRARRHLPEKRPPGRSWWTGPAVPRYVPKQLGSLELVVLDEVEGGYLALYRAAYGTATCGAFDTGLNCAYEARHYRDGKLAWALPLDTVLSRPDHLEVHDIRLSGGVLYFNEACTSVTIAHQDGACASVVAVDPVARRVLWRSDPLASQGRFAIRGCYLVTGYGLTETMVRLIDRETGRVVQNVEIPDVPKRFRIVGPQQVEVGLYSGQVRHYRLDNVLGKHGALVSLDPDDGFGGDAYGGARYGGALYGGYGLGPGGALYGGGAYGGGVYGGP